MHSAFTFCQCFQYRRGLGSDGKGDGTPVPNFFFPGADSAFCFCFAAFADFCFL